MMRDHLKAAAKAAELTDAELLAIRVKIKDWEHTSTLEQAALDEISRRRRAPPSFSMAKPPSLRF